MSQFKKFLIILLVANFIVLSVNLVGNYEYYSSGGDWKFSVVFSIAAATIGSAGYFGLRWFYSRLLNWTSYPIPSFIFMLFSGAVFGVLLMLVLMKGVSLLFGTSGFSRQDFINNCTYSALFFMLFTLVGAGLEFLLRLKKSTRDNERIRNEMILGQFELLKTQVNPHFLFNSLNTLTTLIPENPDTAVDFVQQLSRVFRYSLENVSENTVEVATELKIIAAYIFLNKQRFGEKLITSVTVDGSVLIFHIVAQSLLMLVENAIKHNEISHSSPLHISISNEGTEYLVVSNNLQVKQFPESSTGIGLENIVKRYSMVTATPVVISSNNDSFTVKIPLLP